MMSEFRAARQADTAWVLSSRRSRRILAERSIIRSSEQELSRQIYAVTRGDSAVRRGTQALQNAAHEVDRRMMPERHTVQAVSGLEAWRRDAEESIRRLTAELMSTRDRHPHLAAESKTIQANADGLLRMLDRYGRRLQKLQTGLQPGVGALADAERHPGTFAIMAPSLAGDRVAVWVTPKLLPATLDVAAPAHGQLQVAGLARLFPAHTVHARRSTAVVAGNNCELQTTDHYHVHRVSVSLDPLLESGSPGLAALRGLLKDHSDSGVAKFQRRMQALSDKPAGHATQTSLPVQSRHHVSATSSETVQFGDRSRTNLRTHYIVEESKLPIIDLLARDRDLVRSLVTVVTEPEGGSGRRRFLRDALRAGGRADDLALLDHSSGLRQAPAASIFWLFGADTVSDASAVMVGTGNRLRTSMKVDRGGPSPATILDDLSRIRHEAARTCDSLSPRRTGRSYPTLLEQLTRADESHSGLRPPISPI